MSTQDDTVSLYLLRPLRSYHEAMRDRAARIPCKGDRLSSSGDDSRGPAWPETDDAERPQ